MEKVPENKIFRRLEDQILLLGTSAVVKVVTCTYRNYKNIDKYFYMRQDSYIDGMQDEVFNIKRDIPVYLSIEGLLNTYNNNKFRIRINGSDLVIIRKICRYTTDKFIKDILEYKGNSYDDTKKIDKLIIPVISSNSIIKFEFTYARLNSDDLSLAIQMDIINNKTNESSYSIFMTPNNFYELLYIIESIDLHTYAALMLNNLFSLEGAKLESEMRRPKEYK